MKEEEMDTEVEEMESERRRKDQIGAEKGVAQTEIVEEMEKAYIDYAMSVIVQRALPSVEDGLKPVHRRILYAMHNLGLDTSKATMKCARIVGETMGKFHPHGNIAVYDALVRMAQDFSLRYPLVHGQGNFGCFTADTKVALVDGRNVDFIQLIEENKQGKQNFCYTVKDDGSIGTEKIVNPRMTRRNSKVIKIILDNNEEIICTPDHRFMLKSREYKQAKDFIVNDSLMPLYEKEIGIMPKNNHKVKKIEEVDQRYDVYDIEVPNTHNFSLASGVFVHNSMDGDSAAADRYTEAKLSAIAQELLADIEKNTVKMNPNFDNSLEEPGTLPAKLPNLLLNGATGIAVGMATNIPPHNLTEVCDAVIEYINKPEISIENLCEIVKGPDFPTGGIITGSGIKDMYQTGKGKVIIRARTTIEEDKKGGRESIIVTEIPYMVNKSDLVKSIAQLVTDKKLQDVSDLRDESAKGKVRIVIEMKKGIDPQYTLNKLYKLTNLQTSFDANILALVGREPRILNLKQVIEEYVKYRQLIVKNRANFDLKKAEDRLEIVVGLLIALKNIDSIVDFIKKSENATSAHEGLMKKFDLTTRQAKAVLETRLQQLTRLEDGKLKDEEKELKVEIADLKKLLGSAQEILSLIKKEVSQLKNKYGDERRTKVIRRIDEISEQDMIEKKDVVVMITNGGYIKRMDVKAYREQRRGGAGVSGTDLKDEDFVRFLITASTHDSLLFFTNRGRVYWLKANDVPASERQSKGKAIVNVLNLRDENLAKVMNIKDFTKGSLIFGTKLGMVKKLAVNLVANSRSTGVRVINLPADGSDAIIDVQHIDEGQEVMLSTRKGQAVRFSSNELRPMGRASYGVKGVELGKTDEVVSLEALPKDGKTTILTITNKGFGKRSELEDFRKTARGAKGVIGLAVSDKTGEIITSLSVNNKDSIIVTTTKGMVLRVSMKDLRVMGRATQGVHVVRLKEGDKVADIVKVPFAEDLPAIYDDGQKTLEA